MKKITKNKFYLLIGLFIISFIVLATSVQMHLKNKINYDSLPEVKLNELKNSNMLAIMIQNGDVYEEYDSNTWPGDGYKFKEAKCIDNNGAMVDDAITFADGKATLTTNQTVFCTLYFDIKPKSTIEILREKDSGNTLSEDLQGGMYRYQGTGDIPNWICFGTRDANACKTSDGIDKYMYRIIGITEEGQMYLIKETFLKEGETTEFTWNDKHLTSGNYNYTCDSKICPEWNTSLLFKRLNGTSNGITKGTGSFSDNANTDIFVDSAQYEYLKSGDSNSGGAASEWYNLIANHEWMYGDTITGYSDAATYTGNTVYAIETGQADTKHYVGTNGSTTEQTYRWSQKVNAKISLMYIHDYVYSYYDGSNPDTKGNPKNYSTAKNGWLFFQKDGYNTSSSYEWLSTRWGNYMANDDFVNAHILYREGYTSSTRISSPNGVRPVFYLEPSAKIASGEGTKDSPFILT